MAKVDLIMPKMGESIMEATILKWVKQVGDTVEMDETILEIATDKVDSEIPSPVAGTIAEILFVEDDVVEVGKVIARIATEGEDITVQPSPAVAEVKQEEKAAPSPMPAASAPSVAPKPVVQSSGNSLRFYSPLVKNMAKTEGITMDELDTVTGSGSNGRVTKKDMVAYLSNRNAPIVAAVQSSAASTTNGITKSVAKVAAPSGDKNYGSNVEVIEMDRMRRLIADHMVMSKHTSPHVTSFVEADVTNLVNWRNKVKKDFLDRTGERITFTPIFIEAVTKAIIDYPMINVAVDGTKIIRKKDINVGMAAALPSGNLIVPVIKNADDLNLSGLARKVNDLAKRARENKLKPEEIQGGTFTLTNVGTFGNVMGTPIINQPQVAILAAGAIRKKPAVLETEAGDVIAIRHMMFLSLSYDHRVVDGFLGGSFLRRVADYLENFDHTRTI